MTYWYCCSCKSGTQPFEECDERDLSASGQRIYEPWDLTEKDHLLPVNEQVDSSSTEWAPTSWYSPIISPITHTGLFLLVSVAALDLGHYSSAYAVYCLDSPEARPTSVENEAFCGGHTIASAFAFTAAATALHHLHLEDAYQDNFLFCGMTSGIGIGLCLGKGLEDTIFKVLPWGILIGLLCSIVMHKLAGHHKDHTRCRGHISDRCGNCSRNRCDRDCRGCSHCNRDQPSTPRCPGHKCARALEVAS
jgi:hypothetical protein